MMCKNHIKYNLTGLHLEEKKERKRNSNYHEHGFKFIAGVGLKDGGQRVNLLLCERRRQIH